jgi:hypothetical protein
VQAQHVGLCKEGALVISHAVAERRAGRVRKTGRRHVEGDCVTPGMALGAVRVTQGARERSILAA